MKKLACLLVFSLVVSICYSQEKSKNIKLGLFTSHWKNFEYVNGKVKEIHYKPYHMVEENGKHIKGEPWKLTESKNARLRQPWSYYFNEMGQLNKITIVDDNGRKWIGVVHREKDIIENIYWVRNDTIMLNWDYVYPNKNQFERHMTNYEDNKTTGIIKQILDDGGNILHHTFTNDKGETTVTIKYTRNADGTTKTEETRNKDGKVTWGRDKYKYNDKGLLLSLHHHVFGGEKSDRTSDDYIYKYDKHGNWIERKQSKWLLIERSITYYE